MSKTAAAIPFLDIVSSNRGLEDEFLAVFRDAMGTGRFIGGPAVEDFEAEFARFSSVRYCLGVGSGTDALRFALIAAGVNKGDTVVTAPNTFIATTEAITQAGGQPAFVDIDEKTYNMDPTRLREYLETRCDMDSGRPVDRRTRGPVTAVIPVHLYGQMADMDPIMEIAAEYGLKVVEDACQAHGAAYFSKRENRWNAAGSMGEAAAFSFYPGKNLGAFGEAGAVTTNNAEIAERVRMLRDHGQIKKYFHEMEGYNGRLDAIQAGVLRVKLRYLQEWNEKRRSIAMNYRELLDRTKAIITPHEPSWSRSVYHLYVVRVRNRGVLQQYLAENDLNTGLHYPVPLHLQKAYEKHGFKRGDFPVAEAVTQEILSLPMYPDLNFEQQKRVAETILNFIS